MTSAPPAPGLPARQRRLVAAALAVACAAAILAVICFGAVDSRVWGGLAAALQLFAAALLLDGIWNRSAIFWPVLLWPASSFGLLALYQWASGRSVYPAATLGGLAQLAGAGAFLYIALYAFQRQSNLKRAAQILWIFAGALSVEAILQAFTAGRFIYWFRPALYATPIGPFIYHNHYAGCMDLLLPMAAAVSFRRGAAGQRAWARYLMRGMIPAFCVASVMVSESRGGVLALAFEAVCALALFRRQLGESSRLRRRVLIAAALVAGFAALAGWKPMLERFNKLGSGDASAVERIEVDRSCLAIWRDHPWLGAGFNTFAAVYPKYQRFDSGQLWLEAHDEFAQALAETGVLGCLCALALLLLAFASYRRHRALRRRSRYAAYQTAALIGALGFLFHSVGDFQFHAPANVDLFFLLLAMAAAPLSERPAEAAPPRLAALGAPRFRARGAAS